MAPRKGRVRSSRDKGRRLAGVQGVLPKHGAGRPERPASVADLFTEDNKLKMVYEREDVYAWFQRRHAKGNSLIDDDGFYRKNDVEWKVPYGVRDALKQRLYPVQLVYKFPFFVTWVSPKTGNRLRKNFMSIPHAIAFVAEQAQFVDENATIVSKHGFYIPRKLMGKFPRIMHGKNHYWCPRCMQPQRFTRTGEIFYVQKKTWSREKERYEWPERKLAVIACVVCGITNRDAMFRRSNQPLEIRRIKKGVRRAKRRK